jgi:hypothetical protein
MLSFFRALFALPQLGELPDDAIRDVGNYIMQVQRTIFPVLSANPISSGLAAFLSLIRQVHSPDTKFEERLDHCHVTRVSHFHSKHGDESLVFEMRYVDDNSYEDKRYFRVNRYRFDETKRASMNIWSRRR